MLKKNIIWPFEWKKSSSAPMKFKPFLFEGFKKAILSLEIYTLEN